MDLQTLLGQELYDLVKEKTKDAEGKLIYNTGQFVPRERLKESEIIELKTQIEELKNNSIESEALKQSLLEKDNLINKMKVDNLVDISLIKHKAKNPKAVKALLDIETLSSDLTSMPTKLEDSLNNLKTTDSYLFSITEIPSTSQVGMKQDDTNLLKKGNLTEIARLKKENPNLYTKLQQNS